MTDAKKLRRLAQAATPGPWVAKNVSGAGLEIHMSHPLYPDKEWPAFGTDSAFCKKGLVSYETWTQFPNEIRDAQQSKNAEFIAAANPTAINELLDRLEAAEKSDAESIAMYRKARDEREALRASLEAAEKECESWKGLAQQFGNEADVLRTHLSFAKDELNRLRTRIKEVEKQVPGPWHYEPADGFYGEIIDADGDCVATFVDEPSDRNVRLLTAAPDLLYELQSVLDWAVTERAPLRNQEIESIRKVIAKATGE